MTPRKSFPASLAALDNKKGSKAHQKPQNADAQSDEQCKSKVKGKAYVQSDGDEDGVAHTDDPLSIWGDSRSTSPTGYYDAQLSEDEIAIGVKTAQQYHESRITVIKNTWEKQTKHLHYYSNVDDPALPTVWKDIPNTEVRFCVGAIIFCM